MDINPQKATYKRPWEKRGRITSNHNKLIHIYFKIRRNFSNSQEETWSLDTVLKRVGSEGCNLIQ